MSTAMTTPATRYRDEGAVRNAESTPRRLFIFCDGTWQDGVNNGQVPTNVATLARCLKPVADDGYLQISYYDGGVGNGTSRLAQLVDGATGRGISNKIRNAYSFLSHNYNFAAPPTYTEIYLVGFSRGAFTVQCLASFINSTGLLQSRHLYYLRGLFSLWSRQEFKPWFRSDGGISPVLAELGHVVTELRPVLHQVSIKALIVYDTVSALGLPNPFRTPPMSFVGKQVPGVVQHAFQALALNERRRAFEPVIWESFKDGSGNAVRVMKQCWFLGCHADIGGNGDAALGAVTLLWTIGLLRKHTKVTFDDNEIIRHLKHRLLEWDILVHETLGTFQEKLTLSTISNSGHITKANMHWWLLGLKSRRLSLEEALRNPTDNMTVHFTVRLAMAAKRNNCKLLETRVTKVLPVVPEQDVLLVENATAEDEGETAAEGLLVRWCLRGKQTGALEDTVSADERVLLETWTKIGTNEDPSIMQAITDRSKFVKLRYRINETNANGIEIHDQNRASFAGFLRNSMQFTATGLPSPGMTCPPPK